MKQFFTLFLFYCSVTNNNFAHGLIDHPEIVVINHLPSCLECFVRLRAHHESKIILCRKIIGRMRSGGKRLHLVLTLQFRFYRLFLQTFLCSVYILWLLFTWVIALLAGWMSILGTFNTMRFIHLRSSLHLSWDVFFIIFLLKN